MKAGGQIILGGPGIQTSDLLVTTPLNLQVYAPVLSYKKNSTKRVHCKIIRETTVFIAFPLCVVKAKLVYSSTEFFSHKRAADHTLQQFSLVSHHL